MEVRRHVQKLRAISIFNKRHKNKVNVFISIYPSSKGGGSNTFAYNFQGWLAKNKSEYNQVYDITKADKAVIIADKAEIKALEKAKSKGCFLIHRLDEHVEAEEDTYRKKKHEYIKALNALADVTVYQSSFVFENMHPFLDRPDKYEIILNGSDQNNFYPCNNPGEYIGHITWGVGDKKRLDIVYQTILDNPDERFLLIGNHSLSGFDFTGLSNVSYAGIVKRQDMPSFLHKMKFLFFPSENDPCPNTVIESILSGVPVCYNPLGGTKEVVKDCGLPISDFRTLVKDYLVFRHRCLLRKDLYFDNVALKYMSLN